jgi:DNA-directed RNA polymerase specialized sigma24 family protein
MAILRPRATKRTTNHEALFIERYQRLLGLALQLTEGDRERAEDIVHDAFIQFTFSRPDVSSIENLEGYLYGMLRKLHLSQMRRDSRSRIQPHFLVEYDSAETGLHLIDPRDRLQAQEELRRVCHYACTRKETSKAGSVLILRFFHGYYPSEITKVIRGTRHAVDLRLRSARAEAKATLANPEALVFLNDKPAPDIREKLLAQSTVEFLAELRRTIFRSCHGDCLSPEQFDSIYGPHSEALITCETLAHIVSCESCLDGVNKLYGLPFLSERYAVDTMGKDDSSKGGGPGDGTGSVGGDKGVARCRRRAREVFEHRPQELHISVNGFIQGSQKVNSEQSEQTLDIDMAEQIGFVEVFSEQETRLLFLDVDPPPSGAVEQRTRVELSNERTLELTLSFRGPWPTLHTVYNDPVFKAEHESESEIEPEWAVSEPQLPRAKEKAVRGAGRNILTTAVTRLRRVLGQGSFWLRPGVVTAIVVLILTVAVLSLYRRMQPPALTAANLLEQSTQAEETIASRPDTVLHRSLQLEERSSSGDLLARSRVDVWQSTERGVVARRLYNEKNALVAGDWRRNDGVQTLYQHGVRPQLQLAPEKRELAGTISFEGVWQQSVSAQDFASLIGDSDRALVEEGPDAYVIRYANEGGQANAPGLIRAALVIRRNDLHAIEQTLTISDGKEQREYRLTETSFERRAASVVEPSVFEPEPELLSLAKPETRNSKPETNAPTPGALSPTPVVATAELEVEVLRLIHQAKADMGEQVSVTRGSDGILRVEAILDTDQRKSEVLRELHPLINNPAVKVDVQTVSEALKRQSQRRQSAGQITIQPPESTANTVPVEDELRRYFAAKGFKDKQIDDEVHRFSSRMLDQSREAMAHAWALKRLADRFSPEQLAALDREARNKWLSMIGEHAQALLQKTASLRLELQVVFPNQITDSATEEIEVSNDKDLSLAIERLFDLCSQYTQVARSAFIISSEKTNAQAIRTGQFWRSLKRAESLATKIQKATQRLKG